MDNLVENPDGQYKFGSIEINIDSTTNKINRQTYHILDWLGDIGGFTDALFIIFELSLMPFTMFYQASVLMTRLFRISHATEQKQTSNEKT